MRMSLHKPCKIRMIFLTPGLLAGFVSTPLPTQNDARASASLPIFGRSSLSYNKSGDFSPTLGEAQISGQVRLMSENYDLSCETLTIVSERPKDKNGKSARPVFSRATAKPAPGAQVIADIRRPDALNPENSQAYHILADLAVYKADASRPAGVEVDFVGHVRVETNAGFLSGPSVMTTDHATVLLGRRGDDEYPRVETGPGHIVATPAQQ